MRFDLVDLSVFRHVVEAGSITHGAERAHLALAAASTRIRHMEVALGAALLVRYLSTARNVVFLDLSLDGRVQCLLDAVVAWDEGWVRPAHGLRAFLRRPRLTR